MGHGPKLTEHGGVVGTIDYVSPEYMLNSQVDWRSDIYAIGILGYEMVTGQSPFRGDSVYATMTKRLKSDPERPIKHRPDCPAELERIILRAMARDPEQRYQSAGEMFRDLRTLQPEDPAHPAPLLHYEAALSSLPPAAPGRSLAGGKAVDEPRREEFEGMDEATMTVDPPLSMRPRPAAAPSPRLGASGTAREGEPLGTEMRRFDVNATVPLPHIPLPHGAMRTEPAREARFGLESGAADDGTLVVNPDIVEIASQYRIDETVTMPLRMESVLAYSELESLPRPAVRPAEFMHGQAITNSVSLNDTRIRKLTQIVQRVERSMWVEVVTLIVAILIGVGVGFFVVRLVVPGLLQRADAPRISAPVVDKVNPQ